MIRTFRDKEAQRVFTREGSRRLPKSIQRAAQRKLEILDAAESIQDLRSPPGNRLEKLSGDWADQYSLSHKSEAQNRKKRRTCQESAAEITQRQVANSRPGRFVTYGGSTVIIGPSGEIRADGEKRRHCPS